MKDDPWINKFKSYILSTYVHFVKSQGARVVPIILGEPEEVTRDKVSKLNGILFPGGAGDYLDIGKRILNQVMEINDKGQFYPIWGTCLGYENFAIWTSDLGEDVL